MISTEQVRARRAKDLVCECSCGEVRHRAGRCDTLGCGCRVFRFDGDATIRNQQYLPPQLAL